jgi:hypothetical protein
MIDIVIAAYTNSHAKNILEKYIDQTGRTTAIWYNEHIRAIGTNNENAKYAQYIVETGHS